ncbi:MAG: ABC transporter permease [Chthoniobacter sp.]|nr:ABC transporter permease [Chthoniobacter sp.]
MSGSLHAIASVAVKEFLHIWRDRRIVVLIFLLPPLFTLLFGYAFEVGELTHVRTLLRDNDHSEASRALLQFLEEKRTFTFQNDPSPGNVAPDLLRTRVAAALEVPAGWGAGLKSGAPVPLRLVLDGTDTTTAQQLEGALQKYLGEFQMTSRQDMIDNLPPEVFDMGEKLPLAVRKQFVSAMEPWGVQSEIRYNPGLRFIEYVTPGIIGLILQLLTVTLMACTITREREAGTLSQLMVTSLRRGEIVIGKVLPYLGVSLLLIGLTIAVAHFHFHVAFRQPLVLGVICLLFLLCSLGLGLLISAFSATQTQAIQFAVFFLLPVFPLSGAFAPLEQLPESIRFLAQTFPLTHFCHAFRMINLRDADLAFIAGDLVFLLVGALITCGGAAFLLRRTQD